MCARCPHSACHPEGARGQQHLSSSGHAWRPPHSPERARLGRGPRPGQAKRIRNGSRGCALVQQGQLEHGLHHGVVTRGKNSHHGSVAMQTDNTRVGRRERRDFQATICDITAVIGPGKNQWWMLAAWFYKVSPRRVREHTGREGSHPRESGRHHESQAGHGEPPP